MPTCEICGNTEENLSTVKVSQTELDVCSECVTHGSETREDETQDTTETKYSTKTTESTPSTYQDTSDSFDNELRMDFAEVISNAREEIGLTITELAEELDEKASHLRGIEKGERQPTEQLQTRLEKALGVDLSSSSEYGETETTEENSNITLGEKVDFESN